MSLTEADPSFRPVAAAKLFFFFYLYWMTICIRYSKCPRHKQHYLLVDSGIVCDHIEIFCTLFAIFRGKTNFFPSPLFSAWLIFFQIFSAASQYLLTNVNWFEHDFPAPMNPSDVATLDYRPPANIAVERSCSIYTNDLCLSRKKLQKKDVVTKCFCNQSEND